MRPVFPHPLFPLVAVTILLSAASSSRGQDNSMPAPIDVGDLTSDGAGGWNYLVRPLAPDETAPSVIEFIASPFEVTLPPATPSQASIELLAGQPLALVIPNSGPLTPSSLEVTDARSGSDINVDIFRTYGIESDSPFDFLGFEYLHPLGPFDAGDYRLNMTFTSSFGTAPPTLITGFVSFSVVAIPTPGTLAMLLPAVAIGLVLGRWRAKTRS